MREPTPDEKQAQDIEEFRKELRILIALLAIAALAFAVLLVMTTDSRLWIPAAV